MLSSTSTATAQDFRRRSKIASIVAALTRRLPCNLIISDSGVLSHHLFIHNSSASSRRLVVAQRRRDIRFNKLCNKNKFSPTTQRKIRTAQPQLIIRPHTQTILKWCSYQNQSGHHATKHNSIPSEWTHMNYSTNQHLLQMTQTHSEMTSVHSATIIKNIQQYITKSKCYEAILNIHVSVDILNSYICATRFI